MNAYPKVWLTVAAILGTVRMVHAQTTSDTDGSTTLQQVVVTAQRRSEEVQDVPITVQAITGTTLQELNVETFDQLLEYTPNVTFSGNGPPGTGNIFMRGLSSGGAGNQSAASIQPFPNVALYLDDQSMQFPSRNNDVYIVDMQRIEVLEGPQGTLFGGGAEAGAIRYITNKPQLDVTEGDVNASYGVTAGGDPNASANATINLPVIANTLAIRATIFDDHQGGYISNVPGTISSALQRNVTANNYALVASDTNTATYTGLRASALWKIDDAWSVLIEQNFQNVETPGYWSEYPTSESGTPLAPYQIQAFSPAYNNDKYESTSWTLNGKFADLLGKYGDLNFVYTGSYLDRHIEAQQDNSNYLRSPNGTYYDCTGKGSGGLGGTTKPLTCYPPVANWHDVTSNTHQSHEIRVTTSDANRIRGLFGAYWEEFILKDDMNSNYEVIPQCSAADLAIATDGGPDCVSAVGPAPGSYARDPALRLNDNTAFGEDDERGYRQTAFFTSMDFDLIPKVLTVTGGTRWFHYDEFEEGSEYYTSTSANDIPNGACTAAGGCGFGMNLHKTESGFRSRANLTWHITPDIMAYYTFSQGFRPGGFNRAPTTPGGVPLPKGVAPYTAGSKDYQYNKPAGYNSDNLTNNEIGVKSEWLNHRLLADLSLYNMVWSNIQLALFDPTQLGNTSFVLNGPSYTIRGAELQLAARVTQGLTIQGSSSWNSSNQTSAPCLLANRVSDGAAVGTCITQVKGEPYTSPFGVLETSPPYSPPVQFNLRVRYDFAVGNYEPYAWVGASHVASMRTEPASFPTGDSAFCSPIPSITLCQYTIPAHTTYDAAVGVAKNNWTVQFIAQNLTNSDAPTNIGSSQYIEQITPLRPRVLTLQFGYKF